MKDDSIDLHAVLASIATDTVVPAHNTTAPASPRVADISIGGFFAHIVGNSEGAACALDYGALASPTVYALLLPEAGTVDTTIPQVGPLRVQQNGQALMLLNGWDITVLVDDIVRSPVLTRRQSNFATCVPANSKDINSWCGLDFVPTFSRLCEGATLRKDWDTARNIISIIRYPAGEVFSEPMFPETFARCWSWNTNSGPHSQPVTDILRYRSHSASAVTLRVSSRTSSEVHHYPLLPGSAGAVPIYFVGWASAVTSRDELAVDMAHLWATLQLCDTGQSLTWHIPSARAIPMSERPVVSVSRRGLDERFRVGARRFGKPNCGGRLL